MTTQWMTSCVYTVDDLQADDGAVVRTYRQASPGRCLHEEDRCAVCHGAVVYHRWVPQRCVSLSSEDFHSVSMWRVVAADAIAGWAPWVVAATLFVVRTSRWTIQFVGLTPRVSVAMAIASLATRIVF